MVTAAAFHPLHHELACGFESGRLRVFDVPTTMLVQEHAQHRGPLVELVYSPCGTRLHSGAMDGTLVVYDVLQVYAPVKFLSAGVRDIKVRCKARLGGGEQEYGHGKCALVGHARPHGWSCALEGLGVHPGLCHWATRPCHHTMLCGCRCAWR